MRATAASVILAATLLAGGCGTDTVQKTTAGASNAPASNGATDTAPAASTPTASTPTAPSTSTTASTPDDAEMPGGPAVEQMLTGIPQSGAMLGDPSAPVTVREYIDYKCPICAVASRDVIPQLVADEVRGGRVRLELRPLAFLGPDSKVAAHAALAAARRDRMWNFTELLMANQGDESTVWITPEVVASAARIVGLDPGSILREAEAPSREGELSANEQAATQDGVTGTPTFVIRGPRGTTQVVGPDLDAVRAGIAKVGPGG